MDKVAQKRNWLDKLHLNPVGKIKEKFSPMFSDLMENLRLVDDEVRDVLTEGEPIKDLLKGVTSDFNRLEYITCASKLSHFHDRLDKAAKLLIKFKGSINNMHEDFLFQGLDEDTKNSLTGLKSKFEVKSSLDYEMVKIAGISDWWHNTFNDRGILLKQWQKQYPSEMKKLKNQTQHLISTSKQLWSILLSSLKYMNDARNSRKVDDYLKIADRFLSKYNSYNDQFKQYYVDNIKNFLEKIQAKAPAAPAARADSVTVNSDGPNGSKELSKQVVVPDLNLPQSKTVEDLKKIVEEATISVTAAMAAEAIAKRHLESVKNTSEEVEASKRLEEASKTLEEASKRLKEANKELADKQFSKEDEDDRRSADKLFETHLTSNLHADFMRSLLVLSDSHPKLLVKEIYKYAKSIEKTDESTSVKLLNIVNQIG